MLVIGIQDYEDLSIKSLVCGVADATLLRNVLVNRYGVPAAQTLLLTNEDAVQTAHGADRLLGQLNSDAKLIVYFIGRARQSRDGGVFLAAKDTDAKRLTETAMPLQWLVDEMEKCPAKEKLLLLDGGWAKTKAEAAVEPSSEEMLYTLKSSREHVAVANRYRSGQLPGGPARAGGPQARARNIRMVVG